MKTNKGAAMLVSVLFFVFISLAIISGLVSPALREFRNSTVDLSSKKSYYLAESGIGDAFYRLKNGKTIGSLEVLNLNGNTATTNITDSGYNQKTISSLGNVSNMQRKSVAVLGAGAGVGLNYGIQTGDGGFALAGGSKIVGNVYSNGNIDAYSGVQITGTAIAAGDNSYIGDGLGKNTYTGTVVVGSAGVGDAWAYNVVGGGVAGNLYCQVGSFNNKVCDTSKGIPPVQSMPFTDENINDWKAEGTAGGIISGSTNCHGGSSNGDCHVDYANATFGPGKINGNLLVDGGGTLTLTGTVYVAGTVTITGGGKVKLPSNFSQYSATILSDGYVDLSGGSYSGSGTVGSYLFFVSNSTCPVGNSCSGKNAITVSGGSGSIAVCAQSGTVSLSGGISINAVAGKTVSVDGGSNVTYQQGLASPSFNNGPSGGWNISSWKETQ